MKNKYIGLLEGNKEIVIELIDSTNTGSTDLIILHHGRIFLVRFVGDGSI